MIKVLYLPLNFGDVCQNPWIQDAFQSLGCQVEIFDYFQVYQAERKKIGKVREILINKAKSFKPDLLHLQIQHTTIINGDTIARIKQALPNLIVSNWTIDCRAFVPKSYKDVAKFSDFNFISSTGQIEMFKRELKKPVHYLQIGYNPKLYYPETEPRTNFPYDCIFIGNHNPKERYPGAQARLDTCKLLREKFKQRFCLYGHGWPRPLRSKSSIDQRTVAQAYHQSKCVISVSHFNDIDHYFSDRLLMCMASGRPTIQLYFPKYESYFTNNCDLLIAKDIRDIAVKVDWVIQNPAMANYIGQSGAAKVFAEHTYLSRMNELLNVVGLL